MKKAWLTSLAGAAFVTTLTVLPAQPGTPVDPVERAIMHLEKAQAALAEENVRDNPSLQEAHDELALALAAVREARQARPHQPGRPQDPGAGVPPGFPGFGFGFGDPFAGAWGPNPWSGGDPFADMRRMREEMDEIMRRNLRQRGSGILPEMGMMGPTADMDIEEEPDRYIVTMDLPGVGKDDIRIEARENHLQISGTREESMEESNEREGFLRRERRVGSFSRVVPLPGPIDPGRMEANHENGVLTINAPKKVRTEEETRTVIVK